MLMFRQILIFRNPTKLESYLIHMSNDLGQSITKTKVYK